MPGTRVGARRPNARRQHHHNSIVADPADDYHAHCVRPSRGIFAGIPLIVARHRAFSWRVRRLVRGCAAVSSRAQTTCGSRTRSPWRSGKNIEVIEFFSYGCPHCGELEPTCRRGSRSKPADVQFRRIPVCSSRNGKISARVYYTLEALGEESRLSPEVVQGDPRQGQPALERQGLLRLGGGQGPRPQEGRGHVQLVRDRRQDESREAARGRLQHPVGADDRRRRQVRDRAGTRRADTPRSRRRSTR